MSPMSGWIRKHEVRSKVGTRQGLYPTLIVSVCRTLLSRQMFDQLLSFSATIVEGAHHLFKTSQGALM